MLDKHGKLFGLINLIDLLIILVIIIAVVFVGKKMMTKTSTTNESVILKFYAEDVSDYVASQVAVGDVVIDEGKSINLGTVTNVVTNQGFMYVPNSDGELLKADKEGYSSQEITSELQAELSPNGIIIGGNVYSVGHSLTIRAGKAKIYLKISGLEIKGQ